MKQGIRILAALLVAGAAVQPALAGSYYVAVDAGQTKAGDMCIQQPGWVLSGCADSATMARIAGGYQFDQNWAAEVSYGSYGKAGAGTATSLAPFPGTAPHGDWSLLGWQVSVIGSLHPVGDDFSLFGKLGLARTNLMYTVGPGAATSLTGTYGVGMQYAITPAIAIRAQYDNLGPIGSTGSIIKLSTMSAGLVFKH